MQRHLAGNIPCKRVCRRDIVLISSSGRKSAERRCDLSTWAVRLPTPQDANVRLKEVYLARQLTGVAKGCPISCPSAMSMP